MQVNTEIIKNGLGSITLVIEGGDYKDAVNQELKSLRKKAQLKGFRKGMVPMGMVKKMFGKSVMAEEINKLLTDQLNTFLQETDWEVLTNPVMMENDMERMNINNLKDYKFRFEVPLIPEVEVPIINDTATVFQNYEIVIDDKLLNEEIERLQKANGTTEEVENDIEEGDSLEVSLVELNEEGNVKEGGLENTTWIAPDMLKEEDPRETLLTLKKDDYLDLEVYEAFDKENDQISIAVLGLSKDEEGNFPEVSGRFRMTINTVKRVKKAAIDKELYRKVFGLNEENEPENEEVTIDADNNESAIEDIEVINDGIPEEVTPEFFREKIKESLKGQYNDRTDTRLWSEFAKYIREKTEVELAEESLKTMWFFENKDNEEIKDKEAAFSNYIEDLKWGMILGQLAKHFDVRVEENEIVMEAYRDTHNMFRMYMGGQGINEDMMRQLIEARLKDEAYIRQASRQISERKVNLKLKENCILNTIEVSVDEYNEILQKENNAFQVPEVEEAESTEETVESELVTEKGTAESTEDTVGNELVTEEEATESAEDTAESTEDTVGNELVTEEEATESAEDTAESTEDTVGNELVTEEEATESAENTEETAESELVTEKDVQ